MFQSTHRQDWTCTYLILSLIFLPTSFVSVKLHFWFRNFTKLSTPLTNAGPFNTTFLEQFEFLPPTEEQINFYHQNGYLILDQTLPDEIINDLQRISDHVFANPSGLLDKANKTGFCGFAPDIATVVPEYRPIVFNLPFADFFADLMETALVGYSSDIMHTTPSKCAKIRTELRSHSDANQDWKSIEAKRNFGDNMGVVWLALDDLSDLVTMDLTPESHTVYDHFHGDYSNEKYCEFWHTNQSAVESMPTIEVKLKRGQAVIFQGLTFHSVRYSPKCTINTCRRMTYRYFDGENTIWRTDIPVPTYPTLSSVFKPGEKAIENFPKLVDRRLGESPNWNAYGTQVPIPTNLVSNVKWMYERWQNNKVGIINLCDHRSRERQELIKLDLTKRGAVKNDL